MGGACDREGVAVLQYRAAVCRALRKVSAEQQSFALAAQKCATRLHKTGGIPGAVRTVLSIAAGGEALAVRSGLSAGSPKDVSGCAASALRGAVAVAGA